MFEKLFAKFGCYDVAKSLEVALYLPQIRNQILQKNKLVRLIWSIRM